MPLVVQSTATKGPVTTVNMLLTEPVEERDGMKVEVVTSTDQHHRISRELMKRLGYRWIGGNFSGEIWFTPTNPDMFKGSNTLEVTVQYRYVVELVNVRPAVPSEDTILELISAVSAALPSPQTEETE